jgi:hypothetical protein
MVFSVRSLLGCYKTVGTIVRQSQAGKNLSTEAEGIVEIRRQATTGDDTAN